MCRPNIHGKVGGILPFCIWTVSTCRQVACAPHRLLEAPEHLVLCYYVIVCRADSNRLVQ